MSGQLLRGHRPDHESPRRRATDQLATEDGAEDAEAILEAMSPRPVATRGPGLIRSGAIVALAVAISNLLNVLFQLVSARLLPPAEYSLLVTLFSVLLIANVPILSLQAKVAREVAHALRAGRRAEAGSILVESLRPLTRWGLLLLLVGLALAVPFAIAFNVDRELPAVAAAAAVLATLPLPVAWGGLQGSERFAMVGASQLVYAVLKVAIGVALAALGFGAAAIVLGIATATVLTFAISTIPLRSLLATGLAQARRQVVLFDRYTRGAAVVLILIAALTNLDLIASRVFLERNEAGVYAAASVAARALLLLPIIATTVLFPRVAVLRDLVAERHHLLGGLAAVAALGAIPVALFFAIPEQLLEIGFGSAYVSAADWLGPLAVAMLIYALAEVYMFHFLALGRLSYAAVLGVGLAAQLALFALLHGSPEQIITVQIAVAGLILLLSECFDRFERDPGRRFAAVAAGEGGEESPTGRREPGSSGDRPLAGPTPRPRPERAAALAPEGGPAPTTGAGELPAVSVVLPTFNNEATLAGALDSLAVQDYGGEVELLCIDGGSTDGTRGIALDRGARLIDNPQRNEEEGRALGLEAASGELVLLLDADNELPAPGWLGRLVAALALAPDLVSADCLHHEWRPRDPPVTRLCALLGGTDPLAIDLGWADRWAAHRGRWTGLEVEVEETADALLVRVDPERPPPMGSNGFLVRRGPLLETAYRPFVHSDVVGDLAERGWRFARVREGVVHHYAPRLRDYARKARRRARRSVSSEPPQRRRLDVPPARLIGRALYGLTVVGPVVAAIRGYRARPDRAWALLPLLYVITTAAYIDAGLGRLAAAIRRGGRAAGAGGTGA